MALKTQLTLFCLFQLIRLIRQEDCMNVTNRCPQSKDLWIKRARMFKCTERDTSYTCLLNGNDRLVETCIYEFSVARGVAGCPFVYTCQGVHPQLATEDNYINCPEEIPGCPKKDHEKYTIYEMHKYPACLFPNRSQLLMTSTISAISSSNSTKTKFNTNHPSTKQNASGSIALAVSTTVVVILLIMMAFFMLIKFWKRARRKTRGRQQSMFEDDTDIQLVPPVMSNEEEGGGQQSTFEDDADIKLIPPAMPDKEEGGRQQSTFEDDADIKLIPPAMPNEEEGRPQQSKFKDDTDIQVLPPAIPNEREGGQQQSTFEDDTDIQLIPPAMPKEEEGTRYLEEFKEKLFEISKYAVENIAISPIQTFRKMPVDLLFSKLKIITKDRTAPSEYRTEQKIEIKGPEDFFFKNEQHASRIYLKGNAACGKTTYCIWLLRHWLNAQCCSGGNSRLNDWETALGKFNFVFLIRLRDVNKSRAFVVDMICYDVLKINENGFIDWVKNILDSGKYKCFIIIDGLDEWRPDRNVTNNQAFKGIPILDGIQNCVILTTMRPWKFCLLENLVQSNDIEAEILGLDKEGIKSMTKNVLTNHYGLDITRSKGKELYDNMIHKIENDVLGNLMNIPLLAVVCVQIWCTGEDIGNSLTRFYIEMISMLTERAKEKHEIDKIPDILDCENTRTADIPCISEHLNLTKYWYVWNKLGKLAYGGLVSGKYTFQCYADTLGNVLGMNESELSFSFNVGSLTREEIDSALAKKVKIYFFHTSVQEFFAALYIAGNENMLQSFLTRLSGIPAILHFGSVLKFLSGLNPTLGRCISQHVVDVMNANVEVSKHRKFSQAMVIDTSVISVYELMVRCYIEMTLLSKDSNYLYSRIQFQVSDVLVNSYSDDEIVKATADILKNHYQEVRSLSILTNSIPGYILSEFLDRTETLSSLLVFKNRSFDKITARFSYLSALILNDMTLKSDVFDALLAALQSNKVLETLGLQCLICEANDKERSLKEIIPVLPELPKLTTLRIQLSNSSDKRVLLEVLGRLKHLNNVEYSKTTPEDEAYDCEVVHHISRWTQLEALCLGHINMIGQGLKLSHDTILKRLMLQGVKMTREDWNELIQVANLKNIALQCIHSNIDDDIFSKLSRPVFKLTRI